MLLIYSCCSPKTCWRVQRLVQGDGQPHLPAGAVPGSALFQGSVHRRVLAEVVPASEAALALEGVDHIHGGHGLAASVLWFLHALVPPAVSSGACRRWTCGTSGSTLKPAAAGWRRRCSTTATAWRPTAPPLHPHYSRMSNAIWAALEHAVSAWGNQQTSLRNLAGPVPLDGDDQDAPSRV
jgi:hypothetical protein